MPYPNINPIIFTIGPFAVSWYSLSYVLGILFSWKFASKLVQKYKTTIKQEHIEDIVSWSIVGIIVGGRLFYCLFYDPTRYLNNPIDILKTYQGGMSFHGGMIGLACSLYIYCRRNNISYIRMLDIICVCAPIGIFLGRIANFINGELYGRITTSFWGVIFPGAGILPRHPSQLYEAALEGLVLFCILLFATKKFKAIEKPGLLTALFGIFYSIFRIFIEFFRQPDIQVGFIAGYFTMGQILCVPMLVVAIFILYRVRNGN